MFALIGCLLLVTGKFTVDSSDVVGYSLGDGIQDLGMWM